MNKKIIGFGLALCLGTTILCSDMGNVNATEAQKTQQTQQSQQSQNTGQTQNTTANNAKFIVNGKELVVTENLNPNKYPNGFSETQVKCQGKSYKGLKFGKADIYMLCLLNQQSGAAAYYIYEDEDQSVTPFIRIGDGTAFIFVLPQSMTQAAGIPSGFQSTSLEFEKGTADAYRKEGESGYLLYAMNENGEEGWYEYSPDDKTYVKYESESIQETGQTQDEEVSDAEYLGKKYTQLEETYKKDKSRYRITIAVMVFVIAVLLVLWINTMLQGRQIRRRRRYYEEEDYDDNDFEDEEDDFYTEEEEDEPAYKLAEELSRQVEEQPEVYAESEAYTEPKGYTEPEVHIEPEQPAHVEKKVTEKVAKQPQKKYDNDIEVLDLNDL